MACRSVGRCNLGPAPGVTLSGAAFACGLAWVACVSLEGRIRRGWFVGCLGGALQAILESLDLLLELDQALMQVEEIGLYGRRGLLPIALRQRFRRPRRLHSGSLQTGQ